MGSGLVSKLWLFYRSSEVAYLTQYAGLVTDLTEILAVQSD